MVSANRASNNQTQVDNQTKFGNDLISSERIFKFIS